MAGWLVGLMDGWMDELMFGRLVVCLDVRLDGWSA